jgi:hypothetical protein
MEISIHDNVLYGYLVKMDDYSSPVYELVLYTEYFQPDDTVDYTDVVFSNVITHQFESITSKTVIFDIEEIPPRQIYPHNEALFVRLKNYGWPFQYIDLDDLFGTLEKNRIRGFKIQSSCGLDGWIWAEKMEFIPRTGRKSFN